MSALAINAFRALRSKALAVADSAALNTVIGASRWRKNRLLILCYHGVSLADEHEWSDLYVSPQHLSRRLATLREVGASILPLHEAVERLRRRDLPDLAVSLTFDDGAYDFHAKAAPLLEEAGVHATLYLTTYYAGRRQPVFDTVASYLLWKARGRSVRLPGLDRTVNIPAGTADPRFADIHNAVRQYAMDQGLGADEKHELARSLAVSVGQDFDALVEKRILQLMSRDEIASLDEKTVSVQLHTHRHRTPRDESGFNRELRENAEIIRELRGSSRPLNHFCFPSGDYIAEYERWLANFGVEWATTCDPGLASAKNNPYFLPRFIDAEPIPESTFRAWVSGLSQAAFARRRSTPVRLAPTRTR
jgi:peptidoglycan/xylan/chitin deacetylase (PgdA/CDA1 family)